MNKSRRLHKNKNQSSHSRPKHGASEPHDKALVGQKLIRKSEEYIAELLGHVPPKRDKAFSLDSWQKTAINALKQNYNVIVDAPTTAGKTKVVEAFFADNLHAANFRACYTCPVKSLSNDKVKEFREIFGVNNVGISTGDIKENIHAPIVVATLESYRNSLLGIEPDLGRKIVVFDEYHFLQDQGRGSAWEEAIILTPPECQILMLSASVANASDFASWLEQLSHRRSLLVTETVRPVPLKGLVFIEGHWVVAEMLPEKLQQPSKRHFLEAIPLQEIARAASALCRIKVFPCIIYAGKRLACETLALETAKAMPALSNEERDALASKLAKAHEEWHTFKFLTPRLREMILTKGVAYHHSGLALPVRLAIESLVKEGCLKFCVATMGLSIGINFSVKATLISDGFRPSETGMIPYPPSDILQMTGRAGRRGLDLVGFSCWPSLSYYQRFGHTAREDCQSSLRIDSCTFLGLVGRGYDLRTIETFYKNSFLKYKKAQTNMGIVSPTKLARALEVDTLPCKSPIHEFSQYLEQQNALCYDCKLSKSCHSEQRRLMASSLTSLQRHLHSIGALSEKDSLAPFGDLARYFPQSGGLLVASMIFREEFTDAKILTYLQLLGALSLPFYKNVPAPASYRFPFKEKEILASLKVFYPSQLFADLYDKPKNRDGGFVFRDFNPAAGFIIKAWAERMDWTRLMQLVARDNFGPGDVTALIYRVATYLQSIIQTKHEPLAHVAKELRSEILREPLQFNI